MSRTETTTPKPPYTALTSLRASTVSGTNFTKEITELGRTRALTPIERKKIAFTRIPIVIDFSLRNRDFALTLQRLSRDAEQTSRRGTMPQRVGGSNALLDMPSREARTICSPGTGT